MRPKREHATNTGQTYMVTSSTWERRCLFQSEPWAKLLIDTLYHYRESAYLLHEFVIMPDHFHVIISPQTSLEKAVQLIKGGFSFRAKKELGSNMEVWQKGFQDHRVRDAGDYSEHVRYIHENPVRKHLCECASEYAYSSAFPGFELDPAPQGLKPLSLGDACGAAKAAPFQSKCDDQCTLPRLELIAFENPTWQDLAEGWGKPIKLQIPRFVRDDKEMKAENTTSSADASRENPSTNLSLEHSKESGKKRVGAKGECQRAERIEEHGMTPFSQSYNHYQPEGIEGSAVRRPRREIRRGRRMFSIFVLLFVASTSDAQQKPWNVDQICGRVEYVKRIPGKKHPNIYSEKRKSLKDIPLALYESSENQTCCEGLKSVGSHTSGRNGQFEFRPEKPGHYWLTAKWNGKECKIAVVYEPQKKSSTVCSQQGLQIEDDGNASWWITVTVD